MGDRPTLADIAKLCGVTPATVSRVLNGQQRFSTSEVVRKKIHAAAQQLGYLPDLAARNLNRGTTRIIGIFASPATEVAAGINPDLLAGVSRVLHAAGYDVFFELSATDDMGRPALPFWRFDGAVLMQSPKPGAVQELDRRRTPYVCVNEQVGQPIASVLADDSMGMRLAIEHLASLGHRRVAYANALTSYFDHYSVVERHETLVAEAHRLGLELVPGHDGRLSDAAAFIDHAIGGHSATAIVAYDHRVAVQVMGAAYDRGLRVPDQFSLLAFNDTFPAEAMTPPLTVVGVNGLQIGTLGAKALLGALDRTRNGGEDGNMGGGRVIRVAEELVIRRSTDRPPIVAR